MDQTPIPIVTADVGGHFQTTKHQIILGRKWSWIQQVGFGWDHGRRGWLVGGYMGEEGMEEPKALRKRIVLVYIHVCLFMYCSCIGFRIYLRGGRRR